MRALRRTLLAPPRSLPAELAFGALVIVAWEAVRVPLEGSTATALAHAHDWLALERALHIDVEEHLVRFGRHADVGSVLRWVYINAHLPVLFAFLAGARVYAPLRYPILRAIFVLSHVPAILVIALYPLAPPDWLPMFGGTPLTDAELTETWRAALQNSTAAAASQHFGYTVFVAAGCLWLAPRAWISWLSLGYPILVFLVVTGTVEHYVLDCVVGVLAFAAVTPLVVALAGGRRAVAARVTEPATGPFAAAAALGAGLTAWAIQGAFHAPDPSHIPALAALACGLYLLRATSRQENRAQPSSA